MNGEPLPDRLEQIARVLVAKNGTVVQGRQQINLIEGTYVTLTVTDTATSERVDVTFDVGTAAITELIQDVVGALTGFGGSGLTFTYNDGAGTVTLDVNVGTGIEVSSDALRISTAAAGYGLTGGGGAALDVDLGMVDTTPTTDQTVPADYAAYVPGGLGYTIPSGFGLTLESGACLELGAGPNQPLRSGCRVRRAANQSIASATLTAISWDTEDSDPDGYISATSSTFTVPANRAGWHSINASLVPASNSGTISARVVAGARAWTQAGGQFTATIEATAQVTTYLNVGDQITVSVIYSTAGPINFTGSCDILWLGA